MMCAFMGLKNYLVYVEMFDDVLEFFTQSSPLLAPINHHWTNLSCDFINDFPVSFTYIPTHNIWLIKTDFFQNNSLNFNSMSTT